MKEDVLFNNGEWSWWFSARILFISFFLSLFIYLLTYLFIYLFNKFLMLKPGG